MAEASCEFIWLKNMLHELGFEYRQSMNLVCDNQAAMHIASNVLFYERTEYIKADCHFVQKKFLEQVIWLSYIISVDQLSNSIIKPFENSWA